MTTSLAASKAPTSAGNTCSYRWPLTYRLMSVQKSEEIVADIYNYKDPVDKSVSKNQGIRFIYKDGSRVIFRQSGTGSVGVTIRIYFEKYESERVNIAKELALKEMIEFGLQISRIAEFTGKERPDVVT